MTKKKIILFGAIRGTENPLKGFRLLAESLKMLNRDDLRLVVFGSTSAGDTDTGGLDIRYMGHVGSQDVLMDLYSAADVVAVPSMQEVFGQAATEAMACSAPVVAFSCTGLKDIVVHRETGFLATPFDVRELAEAIEWVLADEPRRLHLGKQARQRMVDTFDSKVVAGQMTTVYQEAIDAGTV